MLAFHQCGFSSGSGDRIPVPAETHRHISLPILALPGTSSSSSSSLQHGLQLLHPNDRGWQLCSCAGGRQVAVHLVSVLMTPRISLILFHFSGTFTVGHGGAMFLMLTFFGLGPLGWAHQPSHGFISAVTVLLIEAVPTSWEWPCKNTQHI